MGRVSDLAGPGGNFSHTVRASGPTPPVLTGNAQSQLLRGRRFVCQSGLAVLSIALRRRVRGGNERRLATYTFI
jgi:hypothetical protein